MWWCHPVESRQVCETHLDLICTLDETWQVLHAACGCESAWYSKKHDLLPFTQLLGAKLLHVTLAVKVPVTIEKRKREEHPMSNPAFFRAFEEVHQQLLSRAIPAAATVHSFTSYAIDFKCCTISFKHQRDATTRLTARNSSSYSVLNEGLWQHGNYLNLASGSLSPTATA